ncbi:MAG: hypothetical protein Q9173_001903, partial [Seirophora scorigena]
HAGNFAKLTRPFTSIPPQFHIEPDLELPIKFPPEACFTNIIAALGSIALGDITGKTHITNYRTTRFPQPLIKLTSPAQKDVTRQYIVWGLFLTAFYLHSHNAFNVGFFSLQWNGEEVAAIGIGGTPKLAGANGVLGAIPENDNIKVDFAFFGGTAEHGKGAVFMTIIASLLEAAPQAADDRIYQTVINYLNNEPAAFIANPTEASRGARGPYFSNRVLIDALARTADFYTASNTYRQLEMKIFVDDVMVAQGAFVRRTSLESLGFSNATEQGQSVA